MDLKRAAALCAAQATIGVLLAVLMPATALASGTTVVVGPSNGSDDTSSLQSALDRCVAIGPGCTVQLSPGHYFTKQLVAYNFQGTLRGASMTDTTIEALPNLFVVPADISVAGECAPTPPTGACPWPSLIIFAGGTIHVSDLSIKVTAPPGTATTGWGIFGATFTDLIEAIRFMGPGREDATVDRVSIQGLPDNSPTSLSGFNLVNGVTFPGEFPRSSTPFDYFFMTGSFTVRSSFFSTMGFGVGDGGFLNATRTTIGGSPTTGNHFDNVLVGMDIESSQASFTDLSWNVSHALAVGAWVVPWLPSVFLPATPSRFLIHDNTLVTTGSFAAGPRPAGLFLLNLPQPWIEATVTNNNIDVQSSSADGIRLFSTIGAQVVNNSITGAGRFGIGLLVNTTGSVVNHNSVTGFVASGPAQIFLGAGTSDNLIVCSTRNDTVIDTGTNNQLAACGPPGGHAAGSAPDPGQTLARHL